MFADVEHLARQQPPLDPPFVEIVQAARILRRAQHQLGGLGKLLLAAQQLDPGEGVAGIAVQFARHRVEQGPEVRALLVGGDARLGQAPCGPHPAASRRAGRRLPARCHRAENPSAPCDRRPSAARRTDRARRSRCPPSCRRAARHRAPGVRHWRDRRARSSPAPARTCPWPRSAICFRTTTRPWRRRGGRPTARPRCAGAGRSARASSDWPKRTRDSARPKRHCRRCAGSPIRRACGRRDRMIAACACVASAGLRLRTSSMTFSSASLSACEVDDVAATAAGTDGLRGAGRAACWRVAGASAGAAVGAAGAVVAGAHAASGSQPRVAAVAFAQRGLGDHVAGDRPRLRQWNLRLGPGLHRKCG